MRHLNEGQLIDLAEGTTSPDSVPHLASCEACRCQVAELRATLSAADVEVPEPSPLFWDHLSARVREGVAAVNEEPGSSLAWRLTWSSWRYVALAAVVLAAAITLRLILPVNSNATDGPAARSTAVLPPDALDAKLDGASTPLPEDPSLSLIADLAGDLDWDAAAEAGLTTPAGAVERALFEMSADERLELQRILKQELSQQGRGA